MTVSPMVSTVVQYILYAAMVAGVGVAVPFVRRAYHWILAKIPAAYRPMLETWAKDAVSFVEQYAGSVTGQDKFAAAVQHVLAVASHNKINISIQEIQGAVQQAYNDLTHQGLLPAPEPVTPTQPKA